MQIDNSRFSSIQQVTGKYLSKTSDNRQVENNNDESFLHVLQKQVNEAKTPVNVSKNFVNADNNTQSKVKESKVNESKGKYGINESSLRSQIINNPTLANTSIGKNLIEKLGRM